MVVIRCRDRPAVLREEEEVTNSLLREGADGSSNPEEDEGDTCPSLLSVPPVSPRLQSTLHCINLSIQQVKHRYRSLRPAAATATLHPLLSVQGTLVGVCGSVGSGKTSLISAVLGQVRTRTRSAPRPSAGTERRCSFYR